MVRQIYAGELDRVSKPRKHGLIISVYPGEERLEGAGEEASHGSGFA